MSVSELTFVCYQILGFVALIQDDQAIAFAVSASQPFNHMEQPSAWDYTQILRVWQTTLSCVAWVHILLINCLQCLLQGSYEQAVGDEHDAMLVVLVYAALW